jgi:hypothetical protein
MRLNSAVKEDENGEASKKAYGWVYNGRSINKLARVL